MLHYACASAMCSFFFFNATPPTAIYTLSLHDALPISAFGRETRRCDLRDRRTRRVHRGQTPGFRTAHRRGTMAGGSLDRKSTRLNSSHANISYAVFCLKKKKNNKKTSHNKHTRYVTSR